MFTKSKTTNGRLPHLLCQGFRKEGNTRCMNQDGNFTSAIPGVVSAYPNSHVTNMKSSPWPRVLGVLGKEGEKIMIDLLLDCGIFTAIESSRGSYHQLSGTRRIVALCMVVDNSRPAVRRSPEPQPCPKQQLRSSPSTSTCTACKKSCHKAGP